MSSSSTFQRTSFVRRALLSVLGLLALTVLVMTAHELGVPVTTDTYAIDWIHPTATGHQLIAGLVTAAL